MPNSPLASRRSPLAARRSPSLREQIGCWLHERWRAELAIRFPAAARKLGLSWPDLCNRHERIEVDERTGGRICHWRDSSRLTLAKTFPQVGARLLRRCMAEWPVEFVAHDRACPPESPEVSIIIGVRGTGRLPQFRACLASLRAQRDVPCEVIVVEQSWEAQFRDLVPPDVRYVHCKTIDPNMPFNRSWALNVGAMIARGQFLVLHDADMVVPSGFAAAIVRRLRDGLDAVRLARFIFYLDEATSREIWTNHKFDALRSADHVVENNPTPMAVTRQAYIKVGGHDESFFGWGGEDNEFLDRLRTLRLCEGSFLPIIHLWHEEAPNRSGDRNAAHLKKRLAIPATERIRHMSTQPFGQLTPTTSWAPALAPIP